MPIATRRHIDLIGAPIGIGGGHVGAGLGPAALRAAGIAERLSALGFDVRDRGDVSLQRVSEATRVPPIKNYQEVAGWARAISDATYQAMVDNAYPIILGGDHAVSIGSINGIARYHRERGSELFLLWIDAHADYNTPEISPTGNAHGMPAAFVCGEAGMDEVFPADSRYSVPPQNLFLFGTRWIDPDEQLLLVKRGVRVFDIQTLDRIGFMESLQLVIAEVHKQKGSLHVSLDLDAMDPSVAPGVGTPEPCGFSAREAHAAMEALNDCGLVRSIDLVELNPLLDLRNGGAFLLIDLLTTLFGRKVLDANPHSPMRTALASQRYGRRF